jgi:hypothetical protein
MGITTGMRGKDLRSFMQVAREFQVIILIRHTNEVSLRYVGQAGFYPKPAVIKAKTADQNPPPYVGFAQGGVFRRTYQVAGLVTHPGFHPEAYAGAKAQKAQYCWDATMKTLSPTMLGKLANPRKSDTWAEWGVERQGVLAPRWHWRVDINPDSQYFGGLQLKGSNIPWSYVHGDYDLKDVIVLGHEQINVRSEGKIDGVLNFAPVLTNVSFDTIQNRLNSVIGSDMVQHGSEAQFAWHGDEPITVVYPDWQHLTLLSAETVQSWYMDLNRQVLGKMGTDYLRDASRAFHFGPHGMFKPGCMPSTSWGS